MARRPNFQDRLKEDMSSDTQLEADQGIVMYSDTWPANDAFWTMLFPDLQGRLGLFHWISRIYKTLNDRHPDYFQAVQDLSARCYHFVSEDMAKLLNCLKDGTLNGKSHTESDIRNLKKTKTWKKYHKYLRKEIYPSPEIIQNLDDWFVKYKCTASPGQDPAGGRLDPKTGRALFRPETKDAVKNNKLTSCYLQDVLPLDKMYRAKKPPKRSNRDVHDLCTYKSDRGEGRLEAFHDEEANMANTNMRESLSDSIHLEGTARWNMQVRERNRFDSLTTDNPDRRQTFQSSVIFSWQSAVF